MSKDKNENSTIEALANLAETLKKKREEIRRTLKEEGETQVKAAVRWMFAEFEDLSAIRWRQYTPYFNDGEPCVFGFHGVEFTLVSETTDKEEEDEDQDDDENWHGIAYSSRPEAAPPPLWNALKALDEAFEKIGAGMEDIFGDGVQVTCSRDAIDVENYDHD